MRQWVEVLKPYAAKAGRRGWGGVGWGGRIPGDGWGDGWGERLSSTRPTTGSLVNHGSRPRCGDGDGLGDRQAS